MKHQDAKFFHRKRYLVSVLAFIGTVFAFILRTNLSIAIVEMTSEKKITHNNVTYIKEAEFDWDSKTKGLVLSVFAIGYLCGPIGGILGLKFGAATVYGIGLATTAFLTILSPFLLRISFWLFNFARILEGVFESFTMVCLAHLFVYWVPPSERSRLMVCSVAGGQLGAAINYPISGFIAHRYGWEAVFYITGGSVFVWYILWCILVPNDPLTDRWMTKEERNYFITFSENSTKKEEVRIPWKQLLTSIPFWVYVNEAFSSSWTASFLVFCFPLYVQDTFALGIQDNGLISSIPIMSGLFGMVIASFLFDYLRNLGTFSKPFLHRVFISTGHISYIVFIIYVAFKADFVQSIICFSLARFFYEWTEMACYVLAIDMFRDYTGVVRGFALTGASVAFFLNPIVMGFIVHDHSRSSWNIYFLFLSSFNVLSMVLYYFYGSGKLQTWASLKTNDDIEV